MKKRTSTRETKTESDLAQVVERNIQTLLAQRQADEDQRSWQEKLAGEIARFAGSMWFVLVHLLIYGGWIVVNLGWIPGVPRFDPGFTALTVEASLEAIFLATFILMSQNRIMAQADRRAGLNLQINLLAEHEITHLLTLTREIARKMGIQEAGHPELEELARTTAPEQVLEKMDEHEKRMEETKAENKTS